MEKEQPDDLILVDDGEIFIGTRAEFSKLFFDASDNRELEDWGAAKGYSIQVNGEIII